MTIVVTEDRTTEIADARPAGGELWLSARDAEAATGWALKPEGFCRGEVCVPVPPRQAAEFARGGEINLSRLWRHLGAPMVSDAAGSVWVLGASAEARSQRLRTLEAPDFALPDLDGRMHALAEHRGRKVLLVSWASW